MKLDDCVNTQMIEVMKEELIRLHELLKGPHAEWAKERINMLQNALFLTARYFVPAG